MKILIVVTNVGVTPAGFVFDKLIRGLMFFHQIDVLTAEYSPSFESTNILNTIISKKHKIYSRVNRFFISVLGYNPYDYFWAWKSIMKLKKKVPFKYDVVISLFSALDHNVLITGENISRMCNCKYAVYSVDAVPAPGWPESKGYYNGVRRFISKHLSAVDALFSSNDQMLAYQLTTFTSSKNIIKDVIYNPCLEKTKILPDSDVESNIFVYAGNIYGARNAKYLLTGFERLLEEYPDSYLRFVGSSLSSSLFVNLKKNTLERIQIYPFSKDLDIYYADATALIDIDADIDNDVFLSSKLVHYLMINRIIISETGINSPSRHLCKNIDSIIQCDHDSEQLFSAMKKTIRLKNPSFEDRNNILELFNFDVIIAKLNLLLSDLVN